MNGILEFNEKNQIHMTNEEVSEALSFINKERKVTIILGEGFKVGSDTEDVFRGLYGDVSFEENEELMDAMYCEAEAKHTLFLSNSKTETPFNERGILKRMLIDNYWTKLILHDRPLKDGMYAVIMKRD